MPDDLDELKNLGTKSKEWLREIGITTRAEIERLGVVEVYKRLKARFPDRVSLNMLWGLEGAMTNTKWTEIPDFVKAELLEQVKDS